jgi:hypothetical protein
MKFKKPILSIVHEIIGWMALAFAGLMLAGGAVGQSIKRSRQVAKLWALQ